MNSRPNTTSWTLLHQRRRRKLRLLQIDMNWIKKRYDQFLLALFALGLLACAILIFLRIQSFGDRFADALANVPPSEKVPPVELERIDEAKSKLEKPPEWKVASKK